MSGCRKGCVIFCLLGAVLNYFFAYLLAHGNLAMTIPAWRHKWNPDIKVTAMQSAAGLYLVCALILIVWPWIDVVLRHPAAVFIFDRFHFVCLRRCLSKQQLSTMRHGEMKCSDDDIAGADEMSDSADERTRMLSAAATSQGQAA